MYVMYMYMCRCVDVIGRCLFCICFNRAGNMFNTPFEIHRRYDLKGSWVGRVTPNKHLLDPSIALKVT